MIGLLAIAIMLSLLQKIQKTPQLIFYKDSTEYFFSDIHGEYEAFSHLLRSSSGIIRAKIEETFGNQMTESDQLRLANLIYYPREVISNIRHDESISAKELSVCAYIFSSISASIQSSLSRKAM